MKKTFAVLGLVAVMGLSSVAYAEVIFNSNSGAGWVGKGDVQLAFGFNNRAMQDVHTQITFEYDNMTEYSWVCEWTTGPDHNQQVHTQLKAETLGVAGSVASDSRRTGQFTGWHLSGFTSQTGADGDFTPSCPGNPEGGGNSGQKEVVEGSITSQSLGGGLYAVLNGDRRLLQ